MDAGPLDRSVEIDHPPPLVVGRGPVGRLLIVNGIQGLRAADEHGFHARRARGLVELVGIPLVQQRATAGRHGRRHGRADGERVVGAGVDVVMREIPAPAVPGRVHDVGIRIVRLDGEDVGTGGHDIRLDAAIRGRAARAVVCDLPVAVRHRFTDDRVVAGQAPVLDGTDGDNVLGVGGHTDRRDNAALPVVRTGTRVAGREETGILLVANRFRICIPHEGIPLGGGGLIPRPVRPPTVVAETRAVTVRNLRLLNVGERNEVLDHDELGLGRHTGELKLAVRVSPGPGRADHARRKRPVAQDTAGSMGTVPMCIAGQTVGKAGWAMTVVHNTRVQVRTGRQRGIDGIARVRVVHARVGHAHDDPVAVEIRYRDLDRPHAQHLLGQVVHQMPFLHALDPAHGVERNDLVEEVGRTADAGDLHAAATTLELDDRAQRGNVFNRGVGKQERAILAPGGMPRQFLVAAQQVRLNVRAHFVVRVIGLDVRQTLEILDPLHRIGRSGHEVGEIGYVVFDHGPGRNQALLVDRLQRLVELDDEPLRILRGLEAGGHLDALAFFEGRDINDGVSQDQEVPIVADRAERTTGVAEDTEVLAERLLLLRQRPVYLLREGAAVGTRRLVGTAVDFRLLLGFLPFFKRKCRFLCNDLDDGGRVLAAGRLRRTRDPGRRFLRLGNHIHRRLRPWDSRFLRRRRPAPSHESSYAQNDGQDQDPYVLSLGVPCYVHFVALYLGVRSLYFSKSIRDAWGAAPGSGLHALLRSQLVQQCALFVP